MVPQRQIDSRHRLGRVGFVLIVIRAVMRQLPISFYLAIATIAALVLGVSGLRDLQNPRQLAFTLSLFVLFFGAVIYRALMEAFDMARQYRKERDALLPSVFAHATESSRSRDNSDDRQSPPSPLDS